MIFQERDQVINHLFAQCDAKNQVIQQQQITIAELNKKLEALQPATDKINS